MELELSNVMVQRHIDEMRENVIDLFIKLLEKNEDLDLTTSQKNCISSLLKDIELLDELNIIEMSVLLQISVEPRFTKNEVDLICQTLIRLLKHWKMIDNSLENN